jgi:glucokinase-like ROK family protein
VTDATGVAQVADEAVDALVTVLDLVRFGGATTRPELSRRSGLGRTVIAQRVSQLLASGLLSEGTHAPSTGGRPARALTFRAEAGSVLTVELGATSLGVGIADLAGSLLTSYEEPCDVAAGPDAVLGRAEELIDNVLAGRSTQDPPMWGVGIGLPGPVEYASGRPVAPPIMPGWDNYPVRDRLARRYDVPVWVDNEVNLMALGELRLGAARGERDVVFIKIGTGIGAGLISGGLLHRGAQGAAGDVGHIAVVDDTSVICRCGNVGCLEALAGGAALGKLATDAARSGRSQFLADRLAESESGVLAASDLGDAAQHGDPLAVEIFGHTGRDIGGMLATLVNFFNPSLVVIGGGVASVGDLLLASIRETVYRRSLPLATRNLRIVPSALSGRSALNGAAFVVIDELFSRQRLPVWISDGSPAHQPEIAEFPAQPRDGAPVSLTRV